MVQEKRGYADVQVCDENAEVLRNAVIENLKNVYDPEVPVNIYDLGLIYTIDIDDKTCNITMSLTSAFCPAADDIVNDVHMAGYMVNEIDKVNVKVTFDPQWGPEMISDDAKLILGIF